MGKEVLRVGGGIRDTTLKALLYVLLVAYAFVCLYPFFLMVVSSFKSTGEIFQDPFGLPESPSLEAYRTAWEIGNFREYFLNSVLITVSSVALILVAGSMAAYPIGRHRFRGRGFLYLYFLSGLMLPVKLGIVPLFFLMTSLGLYDTRLSLVLVYTASGLPFAVFVLSAFFRTLPRELEEAARVDGAGEFRIYWQIMLPLVRPALATVAIFNFIQLWNDFFFPLILIQTDGLRTLPVGLANFFGTYQNDWAMIFAGLTITSLPLVVLYLFASRQIVRGLTAGATKG